MRDEIIRWPRVSLRALCTSKQGLTFAPEQLVPRGTSDAVACFRTKNVQGDLDTTDLIFLPKRDVEDELLDREGDVLVSTANSASLVGKCCIIGSLDYPATYGGFLVLLRPDGSVLFPQFFHAWLSSNPIQAQLRGMARQTTNIANLPASEILRLDFPLPPLSEQRRIVEVLREAEVVRRHQTQAARGAAELIPTLFQQMFGEVIHARRRNPVAKLGTLLKISPQNGHYQPAETYGSGTPIVRIGDFYDGIVNTGGLQRLRMSPDDLETYGLNAGDILVNRVNSMDYIGKSALVPALREPTIFESNMMRLVVDQDRILPRFLIQFLQTDEARSQLRRRAKHAVNQASINQDDVQALDVLAPPISEQLRFVEACAHIESAGLNRDELSTELHAALLFHAYNGSLTEGWRKRNASSIVIEAAARDAVLVAKGIKPPSVGPSIRTSEDGKADPDDTPRGEAWADLTARQRALWPFISYIQGPFGISDLLHARAKESRLANLSEDGFRRELEVFVARGALIHVSRPQIASEDELDVFRHYYRKVSVPENEAAWNAPAVKAIVESLRNRLSR